MRKIIFVSLLLFTAAACKNAEKVVGAHQNSEAMGQIEYLALGDSYSIGESVEENLRWPVQLVDSLRERGLSVKDPKIIARTGWTTRDLLTAMDAHPTEKQYDLVSVLIGVNNQYQGRSLKEYEMELREILQRAKRYSRNGEKGVFAVSIPDYGATPFGAEDSERIKKQIEAFNKVFRKVSEEEGIDFYNITPISRRAKDNSGLLASDDLHPSGTMYALWVEEMIDAVFQKAVFIQQ